MDESRGVRLAISEERKNGLNFRPPFWFSPCYNPQCLGGTVGRVWLACLVNSIEMSFLEASEEKIKREKRIERIGAPSSSLSH